MHERCHAFFTKMKCCAHCGAVQLGGDVPCGVVMTTRSPSPGSSVPPYALANVHMQRFCTSEADGGRPHWNVCSLCDKRSRAPFLVHHSVLSTRSILLSDPLEVQRLALVDLALGFVQKLNGYVHVRVPKTTLLDGALVEMNPKAHTAARPRAHVPHAVLALLGELRKSNEYVQHFLTLLERDHPVHGVPVLPASVADGILQSARERGPLFATDADPFRKGQFASHFGALVDVSPAANSVLRVHRKFSTYEVGFITARPAALAPRADAVPLAVHSDGAPAGAGAGAGAVATPSLEMALFPLLFPGGDGDFDRSASEATGTSLEEYFRMRFNQFLSPFTLHKPYLPLAYMLRQAHGLLREHQPQALEAQLHRLEKKYKHASPAVIYKHVLKSNSVGAKPGQPLYFRNKLDDLLTAVKHKGMPTAFFTLTADEVSDTCFVEVKDLESFLNQMLHGSEDGRATFADAPVECSRAFLARLKVFMQDYVLGGAKIFGNVTCHMVRYEVQGRGSLHAHILLWLDPVDALHLKHEIVAYLPATLDDAELWEDDGSGGRRRLSKEQIEELRAQRFTPEEIHLRDLVKRKQMHSCDERCRGSDSSRMCKDMHPFAANVQGTVFNNGTNRWDYLRPSQVVLVKDGTGTGTKLLPAHRNVTPYHPTALFVWGAHINIQMVTASAWSRYVLKYTTKCEPSGPINLSPDDAAHIGLHGLTEAQCKLVSAVVLSRPVSPCEAALTMVQSGPYGQLVEFTFKPEVINCRPPHVRTRILKELAAGAGNSHAGVATNHLQEYMVRDGLPDVTFYDYFTYYEREKPGTYTHKQLSQKYKFKKVSTDSSGRDVFFRVPRDAPPDAVPSKRRVRFTTYSPASSTNEWAFTLLLRHVPFRLEEELTTMTGNARTSSGAPAYYMECRLRGIIKDEDDLEALLRETAVDACEDEDRVATTLDRVLSKYPFDADLRSFVRAPDDEDDDDIEVEPFSYTPAELSEFDANAALPANPEQQAFLETIKAARGGVHFLTGGPGCGKSFTAQQLIHWGRHNGKRMVLCATTGAAAVRLSAFASTVHSGFAVDSKYGVRDLPLANAVLRAIAYADWLLIDEVSMMTLQLLHLVLTRLRVSVKAESVEEILRNKVLIFIGDMGQLPPVCRCKVPDGEVCSRCHASQHFLWKHVQTHVLRTSVRHVTDPEYVSFLNVVRVRRPTVPELAALNERAISEREVLSKVDLDPVTKRVNCRILCTHREDVVDYNRLVLHHAFAAADIFVPGVEHSLTGKELSPELQAFLDDDKDEDFNTLKEAALNALVIFNHGNDYMCVGAPNGATGYIVGRGTTKPTARGSVGRDFLLVRLENGNTVTVKRTVERKHVYIDGLRRVQFIKRAFPLELAYAMTAHKSQGCTIPGNVVLKVRDAFAPGMLYVMLSRVTELAKLFIVGRLLPRHFLPVPPWARGDDADAPRASAAGNA